MPNGLVEVNKEGFGFFVTQYGGRSSVGRARDCDSRCRGFDPHRPPHISKGARLKSLAPFLFQRPQVPGRRGRAFRRIYVSR